jgi:1,4-alpha-glucan branching enzyme
VICNFTPNVHENYQVGVPYGGFWDEVFNSDFVGFGGSGTGNGSCQSWEQENHGRAHTISLTIPPLGATFLKFRR